MGSVVHLVRHGEVQNPDNVVYADLPGFHLSERGLREAEWAGAYLDTRSITAVYSSPLDRAMETASLIANHHDLEPEAVHELIEWRLLNRWRGLRWREIDMHRPGELEAYLSHPTSLDFAPESLKGLAGRLAGKITELAERNPEREIVVVSHQDPIQAARLILTGRSLDDLHHAKPRHCEILSLAPGKSWVERSRVRPDL